LVLDLPSLHIYFVGHEAIAGEACPSDPSSIHMTTGSQCHQVEEESWLTQEQQMSRECKLVDFPFQRSFRWQSFVVTKILNCSHHRLVLRI
jgi:hypothetical protein